MILWGASPLCIFREEVNLTTSKSTSRRQGLRGDPRSGRSRSENLRADEQIRIDRSDSNSLRLARRASHREVASKSHIRPNPWGELRWSSERQDQGRSWLGLPAEKDSAASQGEHNIPKPVRRIWGRVNAAVVQGQVMLLPGGEKRRFEREGRSRSRAFLWCREAERKSLPGFASADGGSVLHSNVLGDWAEVSRRHSS